MATEKDERPPSETVTDEEFIAALTIQNEYRAYRERKTLHKREEEAAKVIQRHYRDHLRRSEEDFESQLQLAANKAQNDFKRFSQDDSRLSIPTQLSVSPVTKIVLIEPTEDEDTDPEADLESAAIKIQRQYRTHSDRRKNRAALKIQQKYRAHQSHQRSKREKQAAETIQRKYREHLKSSKQREGAARTIQEQYRKHLSTKQREKAALTIQDRYRKHREERREGAARAIQKHYRSHKMRTAEGLVSKTLVVEEAATGLQSETVVLEEPTLADFRSPDHLSPAPSSPVASPLDPPSLHFDSLVLEDSSPPPKPPRSRAASKECSVTKTTGNSTHPASTPLSGSSWYSDEQSEDAPSPHQAPGTVHVQFGKISRIPVRTRPVKGSTSPRKRQGPGSKISPSRKASVQHSLEAKREERKTEKNCKKDKFHLFGLRKSGVQGPVPPTQQPRPPKIEKKSRGKKADTPLVIQEPPKTGTETEPELVILRESSEESIYKDGASTEIGNAYRSSVESDSNNLNRNKNASQIPFATKVPLGTLDSYVVQGMLRKNELQSRQAADNSSYLKSYLRQIEKRPQIKKVPKRSPRSASSDQVKGYSVRKTVPLPEVGSLHKIAHFGRNSNPRDFDQLRAVLETQSTGSVDLKGACRGAFYPVIPPPAAPGNRQGTDSPELKEIPWPTI